MERIKKPIKSNHKGIPTAILCADIHLHENNPVCRLDDFYENTQWLKLQWLKELQKKYNCMVLHAGDLIDYWKASPDLLTKTMKNIPDRFLTVYGNHDLPQHSMELSSKSGLTTLAESGHIQILPTGHWGTEPSRASWRGELAEGVERKILVWHVMTYQGKTPWVGSTAPKAAKLLQKYPEYDLILTGDNHKPFVEEWEGRLLVNPGSLFRLTADQQNHNPRVYLWYGESNTVEPVYVPIKEDVISRDHLENKQERDERINAFIETLNEDWEAEMSFEENVKRFCEINMVRQSVKDIVYKVIE